MAQLRKKMHDICVAAYDKGCDIVMYVLDRWVIGHQPIERGKVVFDNFNGRGFGDNPKYIALEILRQRLPMDLVWIVKKMDEPVPDGVRKVKYRSMQMLRELASANVIVNNVKNGLPYRKKSGQHYIQTWHGGFALKFIEGEIEDKLTLHYLATTRRDSRFIDLLLVSCSHDEDIFRRHFWYHGEIFRQGLPRNDVFFADDRDIKRKVHDKLHIADDRSVALYAPTFRTGNDISAYDLDARGVIESLEKRTGKPWTLIIRLHPNVSQLATMFSYSDTIIDGSPYPDTQELSIAADLLITDYSSMMYDFSIMQKPVFLFANDLESYRKERGLRPIYDELPFPLCRTNAQLTQALAQFDEVTYRAQLKKFMAERVGSYDTGHAAEAVVARIREWTGIGQ